MQIEVDRTLRMTPEAVTVMLGNVEKVVSRDSFRLSLLRELVMSTRIDESDGWQVR